MVDGPYINAKPISQGIEVILPSGQSITSSHTAELLLPGLPLTAIQCHIFPDLIAGSLLSIGQLCDHGCNATFTATTVTITNNNIPIITGFRCPLTKLWTINLKPQQKSSFVNPIHLAIDNHPIQDSHIALAASTTVAEQVAFMHATLCSPVISTWCDAVDKGYFPTWPNLTSKQIRKHAPFSPPMIKGHMDQVRSNQRSTSYSPPGLTPPIINVDDTSSEYSTPPPIQDDMVQTNYIYADIHKVTGKIATDPTGKFYIPSSQGNNYLLIVYDYDSNYIHAEPMKSRSGPHILEAYTQAVQMLTKHGLRPRLQRLDNEASAALKDFIRDIGIDFQLAPPNVHRRNAAERCIRTYKNHLISTFCGTDKDFPLHLWDRLLPQSLITLNHLRGSRINPKLSAYAQVYGIFDYNRTPMAPPGIRVLVHEKPKVRGTWAPHAADGWYTGPALDHYRCYTVYINETRSTRITDTLQWFPTKVKMPYLSSIDEAVLASRALIHALLNPSPATPLPSISDAQRTAITQLAIIFSDIYEPSQLRNPFFENDQPRTMLLDHNTAPPRVPNFFPLTRAPEPTNTHLENSQPLKLLALDTAPPRVPTLAPTPTTAPADTTTAPTVAPTAPDAHAVAPTDAPTAPTYAAPTAPTATPTAPPAAPTTTYQSASRNQGQLRREKAKNAKNNSTSTHLAPPAIKTHTHNTRQQSKHLAATISSLNLSPSTISNAPQTSWHRANTATGVPLDPITGKALRYPALKIGPEGEEWLTSMANEIGRLAQGVLPNVPEGTNTIFFISRTDLPPGRKPTYVTIVPALRPLKKEQKRIRLCCGGDRIEYPGNLSTPTADLITTKLLLNSIISTPGARMATCDISNFYLGTPMESFEYMNIPFKDIPQIIIDQYELQPLVHNGMVLVEIRKGMYGLPQAGIIANERLQTHLATHGYHQHRHTPGLYSHDIHPITFALVVDDFAIKYIDKQHANHLFNTLRAQYEITIDWTGTKFCGLTISWDFTNSTVDISMPGYIHKALHRFQHAAPKRQQHAPSAWSAPVYGASQQFTAPEDASDPLNDTEIKHVQAVTGTLLYYARAVDNTMLLALNSIASAKTTQKTARAVIHLLNYAATHPNATIRYHKSDMVLHGHSDAAYLNEPKSRSRSGGFWFMSTTPNNPSKSDITPPPINGAIHTPCNIMKMVLSSAAEAELGALFYNAKDAAWLRIILEEMGHPQPPTPIQTDNLCAAGILNNTVKQKRSKAIDMRFYWVQDRIKQNQFIVHWRKGSENLADYFTKHHSPSHHRRMRSQYVHLQNNEK